MPKFSVTINDSARHVVTARGIIGAVKIALEAIESDDTELLKGDNTEISVRRIPQRCKQEELELA